MEIKGVPVFQLKKLIIPEQWKVVKNDFVDLEPDNSYPIDQVFYHFDEDILNVTYNDWCIDLGFYGGYLDNNRSGFFKIVVFKGDFNDGEFFEFFISRSTDKIVDKLNSYLKIIPTGQLENLSGVKYDDEYDFDTFHIYSAIENIDYRLSNDELEEIAKAK
ncbi:MAG TPA: hypothetical protein PKG56_04675 [Chitinophagaceae bacterium]|nr:hypothetical protein [Chitinophagales bacterium]HNL82665.1 hypothetical protein [Chitinophagaceae bacterium]